MIFSKKTDGRTLEGGGVTAETRCLEFNAPRRMFWEGKRAVVAIFLKVADRFLNNSGN